MQPCAQPYEWMSRFARVQATYYTAFLVRITLVCRYLPKNRQKTLSTKPASYSRGH